MQRLRVEKWCDICFGQDEKYVVSTANYIVSISLGGKTPMVRAVDVCDEHEASIQQFRTLIQKVGYMTRKPEESGPVESRKRIHDNDESKHKAGVCPECGLGLAHGVAGHLMRVHGYPPLVQPSRCPDCKYTAKSENGMRVHRVKAHAYDQAADMVARRQRGKAK